jgi:hypothetical protein
LKTKASSRQGAFFCSQSLTVVMSLSNTKGMGKFLQVGVDFDFPKGIGFFGPKQEKE